MYRVADAVLHQAALRDDLELRHALRIEDSTHHHVPIAPPVPLHLPTERTLPAVGPALLVLDLVSRILVRVRIVRPS